MSLLSLNCWVIDDSPEEIFTIEILRTKNVSILKEIIKEKNANSFGNFDSKQLDLRKVCLPLDNLDTISSLKLENTTKLSPPTRKLSEFFDEAVDEGLHIIVKRPPGAFL
jgi:Crinkler effector protein N-terminal domain